MHRLAALLSMIAIASACSGSHITQNPCLVTLHTSEPDATLFIDARRQGPASEGLEVGLVPGQHVLELRRGEQVIAMTVLDLPPGARAEVTLEAEPQRAGPSALGTPVGSASIGAGTGPAPPPSATGRARVVSTPPAQVLEDGVALGTTPLVVDLGPGPHALELSAEGHVTQRVQVEISAGEERTIEVTLAPSDTDPPPRELPATVAPQDIRTTVGAARDDLRRCFTPDPAHPESVRVGVAMTIAPSGRPSLGDVTGSTASVPLRACIAQVARQMRFPEALEETRTTFPIVFNDT